MIKLFLFMILVITSFAWGMETTEWKYIYNPKFNRCESVDKPEGNLFEFFLKRGCVPTSYLEDGKILVLMCQKETGQIVYVVFARTYADCFDNLVKDAQSL